MIDEILAAALGGLGHRLLGLTLGADEEHAAAARDDVAQRLEGPMRHRHGLREVEDVDAVARAVDVGRHPRVPAPRLVAEVDASLEQLAHGEGREGHSECPVSG